MQKLLDHKKEELLQHKKDNQPNSEQQNMQIINQNIIELNQKLNQFGTKCEDQIKYFEEYQKRIIEIEQNKENVNAALQSKIGKSNTVPKFI